MKRIICASILTLFALGFATPQSANAQTADGSYALTLDDDLTKHIEFSSEMDREGNAKGRMTFKGPIVIPRQDVDGAGYDGFTGKLEDFYFEADFDGMVIEKNRSVMSGTITGSVLAEYIGQRVLLTVEDNGFGDDAKERDKSTWGFYKPVQMNWTPSDSERKDDDGWRMSWWATDAERRDDVGIQMRPGTEITAKTFPISTYALIDVRLGEGDIRVVP